MANINILIIHGTDRKGNESQNAFNLIKKIGERKDAEVKSISTMDVSVTTNSSDKNYSELVEWADGFYFVSPEYHHSFPGILKTLIDTEELKYERKAAAIAGVSSGTIGGARMIESFIHVLKAVGLAVIKRDAYFPVVSELFNEKGEILDPKVEERADMVFDDLLWMARALKDAREKSQ